MKKHITFSLVETRLIASLLLSALVVTTQSCTQKQTPTTYNYLQTSEVKLATPNVETGPLLFKDSSKVSVDFALKGTQVYYTLDGSTPTANSQKYENEIYIKEPGMLKVVATHPDWKSSDPVNFYFAKVGYQISNVTLTEEPSKSYPGKSSFSLFDFRKGTSNLHDGDWLGFDKKDLEAMLDLGEIQQVKEVVVSVLHAPASWVFSPKAITVMGGKDKNKLSLLGELKLNMPQEDDAGEAQFLPVVFNPMEVRYLSVKVENIDVLPDWHSGYPDGKPWLFVDEILVK